MLQPPPLGRSADTILHLKCVAELSKRRIIPTRRLQALPIPQIIAQSAGDVVQMRHLLHAPVGFKGGDGGIVFGGEDFVDVRDYGLDIGGAVSGHVLADGFEVAPEVAAGQDQMQVMLQRRWCGRT